MDTYRPGALSKTLFSNGKTKKKAAESKSPLQQLFLSSKSAAPGHSASIQNWKNASFERRVKTVELAKPQSFVTEKTEVLKEQVKKEVRKEEPKIKKQKTSEREQSTSIVNDSQNDFPYKHETLLKSGSPSSGPAAAKRKQPKSKEDDENRKRPRRDRKRNKESDIRTVFVGNCPLSADKKTLTKLFKEYGVIESVRFRCGPASDLNLPRRATVITKNYHEKSSSYVGYVVFKEKKDAEKSLALNGHVLDGQHLRVDISSQSRKHDKKRSVFVGNLPFSIQEEPIRSHFVDCGEIANVRIVRDRRTSLGKGIAYVQFESKDAVNLAVKLNKSRLAGREIRVMNCINKPEAKAEKSSTGRKSAASSSSETTAKKISFAPSNARTFNSKTHYQKKMEKRMRKQTKKSFASRKSDGLSSIFGDDVPAKTYRNKKTGKANRNPRQVAGDKINLVNRDKWIDAASKKNSKPAGKRTVFE